MSWLPRPIRELVRRKLNEHGFYHIRDGMGLNEHGFYDIRGVGEITTIDEFKERAFAICRRSRLQTQEDVIALKKKYEEPDLRRNCSGATARASGPAARSPKVTTLLVLKY